MVYLQTLSLHTDRPLDAPSGVVVKNVGDTSVRVSWGAVENAQRYTVTFTKALGSGQQGQCTGSRHIASVSAPSTSVGIGVGQMLAVDDTTMLRAYTVRNRVLLNTP